MHRSQQAFTLIEMMIVVAIIGILAAVAYPNYTNYVRESRREEAKRVLVEAAQSLESFYAVNLNYQGAIDGNTLRFYAPDNGFTPFYQLTVENAGQRTYRLVATPIGAQVDDRCGILTFDSTQTRTPAIQNCW